MLTNPMALSRYIARLIIEMEPPLGWNVAYEGAKQILEKEVRNNVSN